MKFGTSSAPPTRSTESSMGTDKMHTEFTYQLDAIFCPQCENQLPFQNDMPTHQRESAFHFCPHCRHPNPSDGGKNLDSEFKTPRMYLPDSRPSSAISSRGSDTSFHFHDSAQFCQYCEYTLAIMSGIPPSDRESAYNYCPHCGSAGPVLR